MQPCPCGSTKNYAACCGQFIDARLSPSTPEELMRSRYTAYTQANVEYIARTMKPPATDGFDADSARTWAQRVEWLRLEIIQTSQTETQGFVEFLAYFIEHKKKHAIHELSEFQLENGRWYYINGCDPKRRPPLSATLPGRNQACLCGSGKKYKKCCGGL